MNGDESTEKKVADVYNDVPGEVMSSMGALVDLYYKEAHEDYIKCQENVEAHIFPHIERVKTFLDERMD